MKTLLIALNQERYPYPVQPVGLAFIAAALRSQGHATSVLDICFEDDPKHAIADRIQTVEPELIGFSIRNIDSTSYPETRCYLPAMRDIIDFCKDRTDAPLVAGGSGFSIAPREILAYLDLKTGVTGEGEHAICALADRIANRLSFTDIQGIVTTGTDMQSPETFESSNHEPRWVSPDRDTLDPAPYLDKGGIIGIQSKRGCHFNCIYCTYPMIEGRHVRVRDPVDVVSEMERLHQLHGVDSFCFVDNIFNYPMDHAAAICEAIIERNLKVSWTAFFHPRFIDREFASLMKRAGCSGLELGIDAASDKMLDRLQKGFAVTDIIRAVSMCKAANINTCCCLLLGGPGEDVGTLNETFRTMEEVSPTAIVAFSGVRIYPRTEIARIAVQEGYQLGNSLDPSFYISESLGGKLVDMVREYLTKNPSFIYEGFRHDIPPAFLKRMRKRGVKGPLWELKGKLKPLALKTNQP